MLTHGSSCLQGPVTRSRVWWHFGDREPRPLHPAPTVPEASRMHTLDEQKPAPERSIRTDLVDRVRREIAAGVYETPEKWDIALDRLLRRLEERD